MIKEEYVSLNIAKLLKAKGFKEDCRCYYLDGYKFTHYHGEVIPKDKETYPAPTQQVAMRWLREIHNITIIVKPFWAEGDMRNKTRWTYEIISLINNNNRYATVGKDTYEEACEAGIKYCLENLI